MHSWKLSKLSWKRSSVKFNLLALSQEKASPILLLNTWDPEQLGGCLRPTWLESTVHGLSLSIASHDRTTGFQRRPPHPRQALSSQAVVEQEWENWSVAKYFIKLKIILISWSSLIGQLWFGWLKVKNWWTSLLYGHINFRNKSEGKIPLLWKNLKATLYKTSNDVN